MLKKKADKAAKKLNLKRETVRVLTPKDLSKVGGGYEPRPNSDHHMNNVSV
jgi:hypothetical protein